MKAKGARVVVNVQPPPVLPPMAMMIARRDRDHVDAIRRGERSCQHCRRA